MILTREEYLEFQKERLHLGSSDYYLLRESLNNFWDVKYTYALTTNIKLKKICSGEILYLKDITVEDFKFLCDVRNFVDKCKEVEIRKNDLEGDFN